MKPYLDENLDGDLDFDGRLGPARSIGMRINTATDENHTYEIQLNKRLILPIEFQMDSTLVRGLCYSILWHMVSHVYDTVRMRSSAVSLAATPIGTESATRLSVYSAEFCRTTRVYPIDHCWPAHTSSWRH